jgi:hypothetical protein
MMMKQFLIGLVCYSLSMNLYASESPDSQAESSPTPSQKKVSRREMANSSQKTSSTQQKTTQPPTKTAPSASPAKKTEKSNVTSAELVPLRTKQNTSSESTQKTWLITDNSTSTPPSAPPAKKPYPYAPKKKQPPTPAEEEPEEPENECPKNPSSFRVTLKHREANGIGYSEGYSSLDVFFTFSSIKNLRPFFDIRAHIFNDGKPAANVGFGLRYLPKLINAVVGFNTFFDFKQGNHGTFEQLGAGIEILGTKWDFHVNGYIPIINSDDIYRVHFHKFIRHNAIFRVDRELSLRGFDASLGRMLIQANWFDLNATVGGYHFLGKFHSDATGGLVRFSSNLTRYVTLELQGSYDTLFKGIVQGAVALNIPFGKRVKTSRGNLSCRQELALASRYVEPVSRFEMIVTHEHRTETPALDPRTKQPLYIVFVDNTKTGGNGTAEMPFGTLLEAQTYSSPYNMIYVYAGDGTTTGLDQGIVLQNYQWLQGSSRSFLVGTIYGPEEIKAQTTLIPTITISSGNAVTLGHGNIITGFNIWGATNSIAGSTIDGFTATYNNLGNATGSDFFLSNVSGEITLLHNVSSSNSGLFIDTPYNVNAKIQHNIFSNFGSDNIFMQLTTESHSTIGLIENTMLNSQNGSFLATTDNAVATFVLKRNIFTEISSSASSALDFQTNNNSILTAVLEHNTFICDTIGLFTASADSSNMNLYVLRNNANNTNDTPGYSFLFFAEDLSTTNLLLTRNIAGANGYLLDNNDATSTLNVQARGGSLTGLQAQNTGTINTTGDITYIPYRASSVPDTDPY